MPQHILEMYHLTSNLFDATGDQLRFHLQTVQRSRGAHSGDEENQADNGRLFRSVEQYSLPLGSRICQLGNG